MKIQQSINMKAILATLFSLVFLSKAFTASDQKEVWLNKLKTINMPLFKARDATLSELVESLKEKSKAYDSESDSQQRGVNFILNLNPSIGKMTIVVRDAPLIEVLQYITESMHSTYVVTVEGVVITSQNELQTSTPLASNPSQPPPISQTPNGGTQSAQAASDYLKYLAIIKGDKSVGSGFIAMYQKKPVLFTNIHVLSGNMTFAATLLSGQKIAVSSLTLANNYDLAFLQQNTLKEGILTRQLNIVTLVE